MRKFYVAVLAAATLSIPAQHASAEYVTVRVPYGDLDLWDAEQVQVMKKRIMEVAATACTLRLPFYSNERVVDEKCRAEATSAALAVLETRMSGATNAAE